MTINQNTIPFQPYVPGRDTVPNFQNLNMSATHTEASNVDLPTPTWSMSQRPQQDLNQLQQQHDYRHAPFRVLCDRNALSVHSAPAMSEFPNDLHGAQVAQNFNGKQPSMEFLKMYGSQNTGIVIEQKNGLIESDTENEDSDFTKKKLFKKEENISSVSDFNSSEDINLQTKACCKPTMINKDVGIEEKESFRIAKENLENALAKPQATGFYSSKTTLKSPQEHSQMPSELNNQNDSLKIIDNNATRTGFDSRDHT
ncbi:hypothetical protein DPMN_067119 [Dreissena polymorpha]|uniref:Uncharacterized protein n=1 Tax=Dreissena polymorpha TaxID=45954 RepID=A0A9D3YUQ6_DREPO|nr:hypothetical protein DPMN_067119 [Dreissena polymorpha]